jgi:hypothetical protein
MKIKDGENKKRILIVEDDLKQIQDSIDYIVSKYSSKFSIDIINPQETTLDNILDQISANDYDFLLLDHNYKMTFTGKDIAEKSNFPGKIYSISGTNIDVKYCHEYLGKISPSVFEKFSESFNQEVSYA